MAPAGRRRVSNHSGRQQRLCLPPLGRPRAHRPGYTKADVGETAIVDSDTAADHVRCLGYCIEVQILILSAISMALSTSMPRQGTQLSIFECPVVIDRGVFACVGEIQRFTDSILDETFYETTPWLGGLGEGSPILAWHLHSRHCGRGNVARRGSASSVSAAAPISAAGARPAGTLLTGAGRVSSVA
jgi:hypothetical protein